MWKPSYVMANLPSVSPNNLIIAIACIFIYAFKNFKVIAKDKMVYGHIGNLEKRHSVQTRKCLQNPIADP
jgi:hypothetical protein